MEEESEEKFSFSFHVSFFFFVSRTFFKMIRGKSEFFQEKNVTLVKIIYDTGERGVEKSGEKWKATVDKREEGRKESATTELTSL